MMGTRRICAHLAVVAGLTSMASSGACGGNTTVSQTDAGNSCNLGTSCNGVCTDTSSDPTNCGSCGTACAQGLACADGSCEPTCSGGTVCGALCVDVSVDPENCGACGVQCPTSEVCTGGICETSCGGGLVRCGNVCLDPSVSPTHCGATEGCGDSGIGSAGQACAQGQTCTAGICAATCLVGEILCGNQCIDPLSDWRYCGATAGCAGGGGGSAGQTCATGQICSAGYCQASCGAGQVPCGNRCIDPLSDPTFCGATGGCGVGSGSPGQTCAAGEICLAGACAPNCPAGQVLCKPDCVDPLTDPNHCGATAGCGVSGGNAGIACDTGVDCISGSCSQTSVISITQAMMVGAPYACGNTPPEYSGAPCGTGVPGFAWTDTTGILPVSISVEVDAFWNCNDNPTTPRDVLLNGAVVGSILPGGGCVCMPGHFERTVAFTTVAPFVPGATNTVTFPALSASNCEAYAANPAWGNLYGFVTLAY